MDVACQLPVVARSIKNGPEKDSAARQLAGTSPTRVERATYSLGGNRSILLSYGDSNIKAIHTFFGFFLQAIYRQLAKALLWKRRLSAWMIEDLLSSLLTVCMYIYKVMKSQGSYLFVFTSKHCGKSRISDSVLPSGPALVGIIIRKRKYLYVKSINQMW